jgi:hypothetical protein
MVIDASRRVFARCAYMPLWLSAWFCRERQVAFVCLLALGLAATAILVWAPARIASRTIREPVQQVFAESGIIAAQQAAELAALAASLGRMRQEMTALTARVAHVESLRASPDEREERSHYALMAVNKRLDWLETLVYSQDVTGSTALARPHRHGPGPSAHSPPGWYVLYAEDGVAVISGAGGMIDVTPGFVVPELGLVSQIRRDGNRWVVVTEHGTIRER